MKISICGKGGSGKSTISALLANELASKGHKVLVVDTDESNFGLYKHLGLEQPKDFMESLGGKAGLRDKLMAFIRSEGKERTSMMPEQFCVDDIAPEMIVGKNGIKLVAIGKIHDFGEGCACPMGALAREFLEKLKTNGEYVIVDTDAGIEHFGRGVEAGCDKIVVVIDPSYESIQLSQKIAQMGEKIGKDVYFLLNRIDENSKDLARMVDRGRVIGILPNDKGVFMACLKGEAVPKVKEMGDIANLLIGPA
ncbi:MAG: AAA family ATPase [Methanotrichaceae archaeon]